MNAEIFPRDKRSISRREAELVWRRLLELSANTVMKEDITNVIQNHSAIVQRTDTGCFKKTIFIANLVTVWQQYLPRNFRPMKEERSLPITL